MYFFKADISSFDDEAEIVFIIPEQNADENGVPFEEKMITQTAFLCRKMFQYTGTVCS